MFTNESKRLADNQIEFSESLLIDLQQNIQRIKELTGNSSDITVRLIQSGVANRFNLAIVYINGLTDTNLINNNILKPIMSDVEIRSTEEPTASELLGFLKNRILSVCGICDIHTTGELLSALFSGNTIVLVDGCKEGIFVSSSKLEQRGVEEPSTQTVIRGPKDGFTENLSTNITLLRRRIKSPNLWIVDRKIGRVTQTDVSILYLKGIANDKVVEEVLHRLDKIDTDSILESGYLEEFIQDQTYTPFPTMINYERPDSVAGGVLEGQVAILVDGTPFVLLVPVTFFNFFQVSEDYYQRYDIASFLRTMRYVTFIVSMLLPSMYIAITTFHQEMLPTTLLISLAAQREGLPFPALVEALIMEITFEVLREAGVRMPRSVGPAISIVGALVLGQAAVQAGLVSAAMVIVVSFTAISNFVAPSYNIAIAARMLRFFLMFLAGTFGLFGIMSGLFALFIHMSGLRSFGVPYLAPMAPFIPRNLKDVFVRVPWSAMLTRPRLISQKNKRRQRNNS
ncbi:spore germination protein [Brevibacillus formosus]|uniref:spore germination protein n=1 Tax=Brevibacillus formosus TaxID=54913 RepID=UPI003F1C4FED